MQYEVSEDLEYLAPKEKKQVPKTFSDKVTEIISFYDIMGFQDSDLEDNEYDIEVGFILCQLRRVNDRKELQWMIHDVFAFCFGQLSAGENSDSGYRHIAEEIWDVWQEEITRQNLKKPKALFDSCSVVKK